MKKLYLSFFAAFLFLGSLTAQQPSNYLGVPVYFNQFYSSPTWEKADYNFPPAKQTDAASRNVDPVLDSILNHILDDYRNQLNAVGLSAAMNLKDGELWTGNAGFSYTTTGPTDTIPMTSDLLFGMGSITKTFSAAAIMRLQENDILTLDDPISQWITEYENINPDITIRQLLNHTSGVYDYVENSDFINTAFFDPGKIWTADEILSTYINAPYFSAGSDWEYSNSNYLLAGLVISAAANKPYNEYIREQFFDPVGLTETFFYPQETLSGEFAHLYANLFGTGVIDVIALGFPLEGSFSAAGAAGGIISTPSDMTTWVKALYGGDVLLQESIDEMQTIVPFDAWLDGYGLGTMKDITGGKNSWGHGGDILYSSAAFYNPDTESSLALASNDGEVASFDLVPLAKAFLQAYCDYLDNVSSSEDLPAIQKDVKLYPNPFDQNITLDIELKQSEEIQVNIYNLSGKRTRQQVLPLGSGLNNVEINTHSLPNGIYLLEIITSEGISTNKISKLAN